MSWSTPAEALEHAIDLRASGHPSQALSVVIQAETEVPESDVAMRIRIATERGILEMLNGSPERALTALNWVLAEANSDRIDDILETTPGLSWHVARSFIIFVDSGLRLTHVHASKLLDAIEAGHRFLRRIGREDWRSGLLDLHAKILSDLGRPEEAIPLMQEAVEAATPGNPGMTIQSYRRGLAQALRELERYEEAAEVLQGILDDKESSTLDRLGAHVMLGHIRAKNGDFDRALLHGMRARELSSGMFDKQRATVSGLLFEAYKGMNDWSAARETSEQALILARRAGVASLLCGILVDCVDVELHFGNLDRAEVFLAEAEELARRVDARTDRAKYSDDAAERREILNSQRNRGL